MSPSLKSSLTFLRIIEERAALLWKKNDYKRSVIAYFLEAEKQLKKEGLI